MKVCVIGGGWAGMAAAVAAAGRGHNVTVIESARTVGGRARAIPVTLPDGSTATLDNGQHILIGAYSESLRLMRTVGVNPDQALLRLPLALVFPDGQGLALPPLAPPLDAMLGIMRARGWTWTDKLALVKTALRWRANGFRCDATTSVAHLCAPLGARLLAGFIEPLCISALNTPADRASGAVFLRVLQDALFGGPGSSNLLLPRCDLGALFPQAAANWLQARGHTVRIGQRVSDLHGTPDPAPTPGWRVNGEPFDRVLLATAATDAARLVTATAQHQTDPTSDQATALRKWAATTAALQHEAITTVYAMASPGSHVPLARPMLALRGGATGPAQFVFDRGALGGPRGLLAFVVSVSVAERDALQQAVVKQAQAELGRAVEPVQTVTEKRATFACTPGLQRPAMNIAPGLLACGDYVDGPYPATLEGAVRSGWAAGDRL